MALGKEGPPAGGIDILAMPTPGAPAPAEPAKSIEQLKEEVRKNPKDLKSILKLGEAYEKKGDHTAATTLLWAHIEKLDRAGILLLAKAHTAKTEWGEVIRASNQLLAKNPKDEEALTFLGRAQFKRGKGPDEAKETLKKAIEANPHYQPAYEVLAEIYEKNPYEQRIVYQDMVEAIGPKPAFLTKLCAINTNDGENEQGQSYCNQAIAADDKNPDNHVNLGLITRQKGDPEKGQKLLKSAADRFPKSEFAQYQEAADLEQQKNWVDSYKYYEFCLNADSQSLRCLLGLGNTGVQLRKYDRALEAFKAACHKDGRKSAPLVRRASSAARGRKDADPSEKLEDLAERCSFL